MLDKSLPYYGVLMIKDNPMQYPMYNLPDGYSFCMYQDGFENGWAELKTAVGEFDCTAKALKYFNSEFLVNKDGLKERSIFVKSPDDMIIGTTTVWYGNPFGSRPMQRIHWVSVHPEHQGRGIAKALLTKSLDISNILGPGQGIYLTTQTWSYKAINIYLKFGFKPYLGEKPVSWEGKADNFEADNKTAWNIINGKIKDRQHLK